MKTQQHTWRALLAAALALVVATGTAFAQTKKPNILVLWGDDVGWWNISAYNHGQMGYQTPNIDSIIKEGAMFTDWYGQQKLYRRTFVLHHRPDRVPHRHAQGGAARREGRVAGARRDNCGTAQGPGLPDRPVREKIISETAMNTFPPRTASANFSDRSIT